MKRILFSLIAVSAAALVGCEKSSVTAPSTNPAKPDSPRELTLTSPGDQSVALNGTEKFTISVDRDNFKGPVEISFKGLPPGVSVVNPATTILEGKDSIEVTVKAGPDAKPIKDHPVTVMAKAKDMKEVTETFKISVTDK